MKKTEQKNSATASSNEDEKPMHTEQMPSLASLPSDHALTLDQVAVYLCMTRRLVRERLIYNGLLKAIAVSPRKIVVEAGEVRAYKIRKALGNDERSVAEEEPMRSGKGGRR